VNFIFFSVQFPDSNREYCRHLRDFGATVLGIGDCDYHALDYQLKESLSHYYKVSDLGNYEEVLRAVGYFTHKYGKIDRFESLNEHWLELEAAIRTDFNIDGIKSDIVDTIKRKSKMKDFFRNSGVSSAPFIDNITLEKARKFASEHGYPVILKPDKGSGASMTYKLSNDSEMEDILRKVPRDNDFIVEKYIEGTMLTYDGMVDRSGNILFECSTEYGQSVMEVVNKEGHMHYICQPQVPEDVKQAGRKIIKNLNLGEKFFHLELFRASESGEIIALEVNIRPPGAWMTDAINFSYDMDVYREWANLMINGRIDSLSDGKYYTAYANRRDDRTYRNDHNTIMDELNGKVVKYSPIPDIFSKAMGNHGYQFRSESRADLEQMLKFIQEEYR
jgi:biotin carboxylase